MDLSSYAPATRAGQRAALILAASERRAAEVESLLEQIRQCSGHQAETDAWADPARDLDDVTVAERAGALVTRS